MVILCNPATVAGIVAEGSATPDTCTLGAIAPPAEHVLDATPTILAVSLVPAIVGRGGRCCHVCIFGHIAAEVKLFLQILFGPRQPPRPLDGVVGRFS